MYDAVRISRERSGGFKVRATDPEIVKANRRRDKEGVDGPTEWRDPDVEFVFEDKDKMLDFVGKAVDIALPDDEYSSVFDKLAKEAKSND